jgi:hypothetical protein
MEPIPEYLAGQHHWWHTNTGAVVGVVRLIGQINSMQSMNDYGVGNWYVEVVETGVRLVVRRDRLGGEVPDMEVIAWAAK